MNKQIFRTNILKDRKIDSSKEVNKALLNVCLQDQDKYSSYQIIFLINKVLLKKEKMCKRPYLTLYALQTLEVWGENRPFLGGIFFLRVFFFQNGRYPTPKIYFLFYFQMSQNAFKKKSKLLTNLYSFSQFDSFIYFYQQLRPYKPLAEL